MGFIKFNLFSSFNVVINIIIVGVSTAYIYEYGYSIIQIFEFLGNSFELLGLGWAGDSNLVLPTYEELLQRAQIRHCEAYNYHVWCLSNRVYYGGYTPKYTSLAESWMDDFKLIRDSIPLLFHLDIYGNFKYDSNFNVWFFYSFIRKSVFLFPFFSLLLMGIYSFNYEVSYVEYLAKDRRPTLIIYYCTGLIFLAFLGSCFLLNFFYNHPGVVSLDIYFNWLRFGFSSMNYDTLYSLYDFLIDQNYFQPYVFFQHPEFSADYSRLIFNFYPKTYFGVTSEGYTVEDFVTNIQPKNYDFKGLHLVRNFKKDYMENFELPISTTLQKNITGVLDTSHNIINWGVLYDLLSIIMIFVVLSISFCVHFYSIGYLSNHTIFRFFFYISLFTFFMLILVTSSNFLMLFLGWEGVGVCSYLLINFWYNRIQANKAAMKALLVNRVGDVGLSIGIFLIFYIFGTLDFYKIFTVLCDYKVENISLILFGFEVDVLTLICTCLFIGSMGKSAQLGLHTWLPDAMEGPTPVSALIHAATMVTAGVFLIIRCSPLFEHASFSLLLVTVVGASTAFVAGTIGLVQNDIKKIVAYSTCSQLGYMVFSCGLSNYVFSFYHLANHAFFKALLFLSAGSIIHSVFEEQDLRKMGGLIRLLPFVYSIILIGNLALIGFPFLSGFYSKDLILETAYLNYKFSGYFAYWLGIMTAFLTACYTFRSFFLIFFYSYNGYKSLCNKIFESSFHMVFSLCFLTLGSLFIGFKLRLIFLDQFFYDVVFIKLTNTVSLSLPFYIKILPFILSICGILLVFILFNFFEVLLVGVVLEFFNIYCFLKEKWYFDKIYNTFAIIFLVFCYDIVFLLFEKGIFELLTYFGLSRSINWFSKSLVRYQTGFLYSYLCIGFVFFIVFFYLLIIMVLL